MSTSKTIAAATLALILVLPSVALAESASTSMQVSVTVLARALVTVDSQPASIEVTESDIERGYVDVAEPIVVRVRTNSRRGYLLSLANASDVFSAVEVSFADTSMRTSHESWIQRPYVPGGEALSLKTRLFLSRNTPPGTHALPIALSATPI